LQIRVNRSPRLEFFYLSTTSFWQLTQCGHAPSSFGKFERRCTAVYRVFGSIDELSFI
jgi:hypothetical protein